MSHYLPVDFALNLTRNVFQATPMECAWLVTLEVDKWYYANVHWDEYFGPYDSEAEANTHFQAHIAQVRTCPTCEE